MKAFVLVSAASLTLLACGGNTINTGTTGSMSGVQQAAIGAAGGQIALSGDATITVPQGALTATTTFTLAQSSTATAPAASQAAVVGPYVVLGPAGTTFGSPITVALTFDPTQLPAGASAANVVVLSDPTGSGNYTSLGGTSVNSTHVSATTTNAGTFVAGVIAAAVPGYPGVLTDWGVATGSIFPDFSLAGGAAINFATTPTADISTGFASSFSFLDLYQARAMGFRYAFIDISAVWCPHCNDEAKTLPTQYVPTWLTQGGIVFSILVQSENQDQPATQSDLTNWITEYKTNYPISLDTQENMVSGTGLNAWPANIIVRLSDMVVIDSVFGATDAFYDEFANVLTLCSTTADCWSGATCTGGTCH